MAAPPIRIRIGASLDAASLNRTFETVEKRAKKAEQVVRKEARDTARAAKSTANEREKAERELTRAAESLARQRSRALYAAYQADQRAAQASAKAQERAAMQAQRAHERSWNRIRAGLERTARAAERAAEREARARDRAHRRAGDRFATRTSHRATRFLMPEAPIGSMAMRGLGDVARGMGVDFSLQGGVQRSTELQSAATQLANQERIATGSTRGAGHYAALGRKVGDDVFADPGSSLALASRFAARTGTYDNLDSITPGLASLARASGADFADVGEAAGMVFQQFRGQADAVDKTLEVMRTIIGQSAEGAVDMPDYAKQLGRVAAGAFKFEGDRGRNVAALSALTQISMERGATSAADAARSTGSFVSTLGKGARLAEFEAAGVRVYSDDTVDKDGKVVAGEKRTQLRPLEDIIKDSFRATGGNIPQLGRMYMDVLGRKGVESLGAEYQAAGGGEAGIQAIQKVFDRYMNATITKDVEKQNLADVEGTTAAKAQKFQNALDRVTENVMSRLAPALESASPALINFAETVGRVATWAVENPKSTIALAISASIARAGIESTLRAGIERLIMGANNSRAGKVGQAVGTLGAIGAGAGLAISVLQVAAIYADALYSEQREQADKEMAAGVAADDLLIAAKKAAEQGDTKRAKELAEKSLAKRQEEIQAHENQKLTGIDKVLDDMAAGAVKTFGGEAGRAAIEGEEQSNKTLAEMQRRASEETNRLLASLNSKLESGIEVTNMPSAPRRGRTVSQFDE